MNNQNRKSGAKKRESDCDSISSDDKIKISSKDAE